MVKLSILKTAEDLQGKGFSVIAIQPDQKIPVNGRKWKDLNNENCILFFEEDLKKYHNVNLAIIPPEGYGFIDIDIKNGVDGLENLKKIAPSNWFENETCPMQTTPSGGYHLVYRLPEALRNHGNQTGRLPNGIDVRSNGQGYILTAPSTINGMPYIWERPLVDVEFLPLMPQFIVDALLDEKEKPPIVDLSKRTRENDSSRFENVLVDAIDKVRTAQNGARNTTLNEVAFTLSGIAADENINRDNDIINNLLPAAIESGLSEIEALKTIDSALRAGNKSPLPPKNPPILSRQKSCPKKNRILADKPTIFLSAEISKTIKQITENLHVIPGLYQRGGALVRIVKTQEIDAQKKVEKNYVLKNAASTWVGIPVIRETTSHVLRHYISENMNCLKLEKSKKEENFVSTTPPHEIALTISQLGEYEKVPPLKSIVTTPFLRPDGSICNISGYDNITGYFYEPSITFPSVPDNPTLEQCQAAFGLCEDIFIDFPFETKEQSAIPIAIILSHFARSLIGNMPLFLIDACSPGSGKTLTVDLISSIICGQTAPKLSYPTGKESGAELEKILSSIAMDSPVLACFDNIALGAHVGGPALDKVITCNGYTQFRILGKTELKGIPWNTILVMTGNNASSFIRDDTRRRVMTCRLVPNVERPETRSGFKYPDILAHVKENRPQLVAAALTILRYWFLNKSEKQKCVWGSFESWARVIPEAIELAGGPNIMNTLSKEEDTMSEEILSAVDVYKMLYREFPNGATSGEIFNTKHLNVTEPLENVLGRGYSSKSIGRYLKAKKDRIFSGMRLRLANKGHRKVRYWVESVDVRKENIVTQEPIPVQQSEPIRESLFTHTQPENITIPVITEKHVNTKKAVSDPIYEQVDYNEVDERF